MALDVKIKIDKVRPIGSVGFGCPLILVENATKGIDYAEYFSVNELLTKGFTNTSKTYATAQLMFSQTHAPEKIAVCAIEGKATEWLAVEGNVSKNWRQLVVIDEVGTNASAVADIMGVIENETKHPKFYYANLDYTATAPANIANVERTLLCYYTPTATVPCPVAAIAGEVSGLEVGSYTINNLVVKGVTALELTDTEIADVHAKGGVTFVLAAGDCVVSEGKTAGGSYVDDIDGDDYIKQQLEYKTQKVFNDNLKIPYTNAGIAMLESAAIGVMTDAQNKSIVDTFTVNYLLREEVSGEDRAARRYIGGNISYSKAGAIHEIEIKCEIAL